MFSFINKIRLQQILDIVLLKKYENIDNLKKIGILVGFSNLTTCSIFYFWLFLFVNKETWEIFNSGTTILLIVAIFIHLFFNFVLINWVTKYEVSKWTKWVWLSLIFISPLGLCLIFSISNSKYWTNIKIKEEKNSVFHSLSNSIVNLEESLKRAVSEIKNNYPEGFQKLLEIYDIREEEIKDWNGKIKHTIIALEEALRQNKKKNNFDDLVFNENWYDTRKFDFALIDPKSRILPKIKYKYSLAFLIIDEFNNYHKILQCKKEIKENIKFGPAKIICLHWGKGFKIYMNE